MNQLYDKKKQSFKIKLLIAIALMSFFSGLGLNGMAQPVDSLKIILNSQLKEKTSTDFYIGDQNYRNGKKVKVDTVFYNETRDTLIISFNKALAEMPVREQYLASLTDSFRVLLLVDYSQIPLKIVANKEELSELVPNYYRTDLDETKSRLTPKGESAFRKNVVHRQKPFQITAGLNKSNIALWNSHGWYYEPKFDRWEWQRARLFSTLEDISPTAFVIPFIAPMLENAGANVFIPRERDWQTNEVIVDNNGSTGKSKFKKPKGKKSEETGFTIGNQPYKNENPFQLGTFIQFKSSKRANGATYIPDIPEKGEYAVYVSYGKGDGKVIYRVHHTGGTTDFEVDQRMGYGTWIYLDKFRFNKGLDKKSGKVELIVPEGSDHSFSADAVRFGGGMGVIERNGKTAGRAKFFEGARYYTQYAGAPDTLVWKLNDNDDYKDDYMCRGEWVDWLMGAPNGPVKNRQYLGLGIPIDMAFAFHTDAGILPGDDIVGTLGIYSTNRDTSVFANGQSKYASRDLTDLIQTQVVDDINAIYKCNWTRRGMWNSQYSEAYRPQVPTMLLELLSHQNLNDVKYVLNPKFKFDVSRAVYKGMLRFLATQNGYEYVVQPLPVDHVKAEFLNESSVKISWQPVEDPLESTANPDKYVVYKRTGDLGFDNGTVVESPEITISNLEKETVYGFKITALNDGGESFPSEIISLGIADNSKGEVLIVNGFDRVDGPEIFVTDSLSGVLRQLDHGVAYGFDISTTGDQYDFNSKSVWQDDDSPGHGASYADLETKIFRGNTFDFSYVHGNSILSAGYSFVTSSDEAFEDGQVEMNKYEMVDLLYGEEKTTLLPGKDSTKYFEIYTDKMLSALEDFTENGGSVLISGANIGSEISKDKKQVQRIGNLFGFKWRTNHAVKNGQFYASSEKLNFTGEFNTDYNLEQYPVEAPDGIEPFDKSGQTVFRYNENNVSAGVFSEKTHKVVALGFPFESIKGESQRKKLMKEILELFDN